MGNTLKYLLNDSETIRIDVFTEFKHVAVMKRRIKRAIQP